MLSFGFFQLGETYYELAGRSKLTTHYLFLIVKYYVVSFLIDPELRPCVCVSDLCSILQK